MTIRPNGGNYSTSSHVLCQDDGSVAIIRQHDMEFALATGKDLTSIDPFRTTERWRCIQVPVAAREDGRYVGEDYLGCLSKTGLDLDFATADPEELYIVASRRLSAWEGPVYFPDQVEYGQ